MGDIWTLIAATALLLVVLTLRVIGRTVVTMPMICIGVGALLAGLGHVPLGVMEGGLETIAEITLAVILFADASQLTLTKLRRESGWAVRMLFVGLPLALLIGTVLFMPILPELPFWQVALIAALLVPTDAALGQAVFTNPDVPEKLRDTLTAESGLNDGLALPAIIFIACAAVGFEHDLSQQNWLIFAGKQILLGAGLGAVLGFGGGFIAVWGVRQKWMENAHAGIFGLLLIAAVFLAADSVGGNGFVAVFIAGLCYGRASRECAATTSRFLENEGMILMMIAFLYIGAILLPKGLILVDWPIAIVVALSLFIVRPLAVWLSLIGSGASHRTRVFLGWFGPRGLATALFALLILHEFMGKLQAEVILPVTALAVAASALMHGVSAHFAATLCDAQPLVSKTNREEPS